MKIKIIAYHAYQYIQLSQYVAIHINIFYI